MTWAPRQSNVYLIVVGIVVGIYVSMIRYHHRPMSFLLGLVIEWYQNGSNQMIFAIISKED